MASVDPTQNNGSLAGALGAVASATNAPQTTQSGTPIVSGPKQLGQHDFLNLLVAQLKNQDPLKPMENEAFVAQLAQFSQLESTNQLVTLMEKSNEAQASTLPFSRVPLIGHQVKINSATVDLADGPATVSYSLGGNAASVQVGIVDANGRVIRTISAGAQSAGTREVTWDGEDQNGQAVEQGTYGFAVSAVDSQGRPVTATPLSLATVTGVRTDSGNPVLLLGNRQVDAKDVLEVY